MPQQIGWSVEAKLLYQLKQQVARFGGGGGGATVIEITLGDVLTAISAGTLTPGAIYKITGVHKDKVFPSTVPSLYNDGTDSGTTIYLQAVSATELSATGWGEFYNPKYKPFTDYTNVDGTGLWGIYQDAVSYVVGDTTIWGGYVWSCISDSTGNTSLNDFTLDPTYWVKVPYSNTLVYDKVLDIIECDLTNDYISMRYDVAADNLAKRTIAEADWTPFIPTHAIVGLPWGLSGYNVSPVSDVYYGVNNVHVTGAVAVLVNFKGAFFIDATFEKQASIQNCTFGADVAFTNVTFTNYGGFSNCDFQCTGLFNGYIDQCIFDYNQWTSINFNNFYASSCKFLDDCRFNGGFPRISITNCTFSYSTFTSFAIVGTTVLNTFNITKSTFSCDGSATYSNGIQNSTLTGIITGTDWRSTIVSGFNMTQGFEINNCKVHNSNFQNGTYSGANARVFKSCEITNCTFNFAAASAAGAGGVTNTTNLKAYGVTVANASFAAINNTYFKQLVLNSGSTNTLSYFNGANVLTNATF